MTPWSSKGRSWTEHTCISIQITCKCLHTTTCPLRLQDFAFIASEFLMMLKWGRSTAIRSKRGWVLQKEGNLFCRAKLNGEAETFLWVTWFLWGRRCLWLCLYTFLNWERPSLACQYKYPIAKEGEQAEFLQPKKTFLNSHQVWSLLPGLFLPFILKTHCIRLMGKIPLHGSRNNSVSWDAEAKNLLRSISYITC